MGDRTHHRRERLRIIEEWSRTGVLAERRSLPVEQQFRDRVSRTGSRLFVPLGLAYSDDPWYNTQVSHLLEAYDALPHRPDLAFDSVWKVFESTAVRTVATRTGRRRNITESLRYVSDHVALDGAVFEAMTAEVPSQTCEYLFKKVVLEAATEKGRRVGQRLTGGAQDATAAELRTFLDLAHAPGADLDANRRRAMLLRRALAGERLRIGAEEVLLSARARSRLLLGGLLYTARNERYHGESFSPFYSSTASLKTYTHPHYLFLATYALVHLLWAQWEHPYSPHTEAVAENVTENLREARTLYGRHWLA
ncbi:hypothetical protein [Streptomyces sclerotialus]|uniref:hypothetical protein n=1 Tax=Streptomyces sclerotialus TaxID=1957 RepID=UPI0004C6A7C7